MNTALLSGIGVAVVVGVLCVADWLASRPGDIEVPKGHHRVGR